MAWFGILLDKADSLPTSGLPQALQLAAEAVLAANPPQPIRKKARNQGSGLDSGSGLSWSHGTLRVDLYSWNSPLELEIYVSTPDIGYRVRHPMPRNLKILRDRPALSKHIERVAAVIAGATPISSPKAEKILERFDTLAVAASACAKIARPDANTTVAIQAPSPFEKPLPTFVETASQRLIPTTGFNRLLSDRLPTIVMVKPDPQDPLHCVLAPAIHYVNPDGLSPVEIMRLIKPIPKDRGEMVTWAEKS